MKKALYLVRAENGLVKIGIATSPKRRFLAMRTDSPIRVKLIYMASIDNVRVVESELHQEFAAKRSHGEWFALDDTDIASIQFRWPACDMRQWAEKRCITLGLTPAEHELLSAAAKEEGRPLTQFLLFHGLAAAGKILDNSLSGP